MIKYSVRVEIVEDENGQEVPRATFTPSIDGAWCRADEQREEEERFKKTAYKLLEQYREDGIKLFKIIKRTYPQFLSLCRSKFGWNDGIRWPENYVCAAEKLLKDMRKILQYPEEKEE